MKRLIKFHNQYQNDGVKFSTCSTKYEILDGLFPDSAGIADIKRYAKDHQIPVLRKNETVSNEYDRALVITECLLQARETKLSRWGDPEETLVWLGLISLPTRGPLEPIETTENPISADQLYEILNNQHYGVSDLGEHVDGDTCLVIESWDFFHSMPLLGYPLAEFYKACDITDYHGFSDDTYRCEGCNKFDDRDNGYTTNHRVVDDCTLLGINCDCYTEHCESEFMEFADDTNKAIELSTAETLAESGKLEHIERFIGGMTDGRGGSYNGESIREGTPESVLADLKKANPETQYLFTHDESGQFQTYFSVWQILAD